MTQSAPPKSTGEMMADIMGNMGSLVRNEVDLARAETAESLSKTRAALGGLALALILAITALNVLAAFLVVLAGWMGLPPPYATLAVGLGLLLLAGVIYLSAKSALNAVNFMPSRAAHSVRRDAAAIKESFNDK